MMPHLTVARYWYVPACLLFVCLCSCNVREPEPTEFLAGNLNEWQTQFEAENEELWYVADGRLNFKGDRSSSKLTVSLDSISSENLKPGRLTASVQVNGVFKEEYSDALYGFELSKIANNSKVKLVLTGAGDIVAFDERLVALPMKMSRLETCTPKHNNDAVTLSFAMYGYDTRGWTFDVLVKNCEEEDLYMLRAFVEADTKVQFDELSLIAYKSVDSNVPVWFSDLKIWKDWVPFD